MIPEPYGGRLVNLELREAERSRLDSELPDLPQLTLSEDEAYDLEKIGTGAYSPLEGFMDSDTLEGVLDRSRLDHALPWTLPILLAPRGPRNAKAIAALNTGEDAALLVEGGRFVGLIRVEEKFAYDKRRVAQGSFGTTDSKHPNVSDLKDAGEVVVAGKISLLRRLEASAGRVELTPSESREAFRSRGWSNVAAYQCRNPPHTAHEYLQRLTLEREDVDGLFIHPVVGRLKKGDYKPDVIMEAYDALVRAYYPPTRVLLSPLTIAMRYAGPKAALFLAIVRRNFGCSRYIVGRDQAGVGSYYDPYAAHRIFDELDIGVTPIRYEESFLCRHCGWMASPRTCPHPASDRVDASQTRIRNALAKGEEIPKELLRPEVAEILRRPGGIITE
jgi:sulfate adenylyltransferase